jgi:hypothetical protein
MAIPLIFYKANDNFLTLPNVRDALTAQLISGAEITAYLVDSDGESVDGNFDGVDMTESGTQPGTYQCTIPGSFDPPAGIYNVLYIGETQDGKHMQIKQRAEVLEREVK